MARPAPHAWNTANQRRVQGPTGSPSSGEEIDLDGIRPDMDDEVEDLASAPSSERVEPTATGSLGPSPAPSVQHTASTKKSCFTADDIWHFFSRGSQKENVNHVCLQCKYIHFLPFRRHVAHS